MPDQRPRLAPAFAQHDGSAEAPCDTIKPLTELGDDTPVMARRAAASVPGSRSI